MHSRFFLLVVAAAFGELWCDQGGRNTFPPEGQKPFFEKGLILPPNSLPCVPESTGIPQDQCNHHGSTVAELSDGTVAAVWFHGEYEKSTDSRIVWSRLRPLTDSWTPPEVLFDDPGRAEGNAALWLAEDDSLYVFFVTIFGSSWDESKIRVVRSSNGGENWTDPVTLREEYCWMVRHRPLRVSNGELILPLYNECLALPVFMYSADDFGSWQEQQFDDLAQYLLDHVGQIQPALVQRSDGSLVAVTRDGGSRHRIHRMVSRDQGRSFSASEPTELPNSGTSVDQLRLLDGHLVVVFNNSPVDRFPLAAALSTDQGETFTAVRHLNAECDRISCSYAYPSVTQSARDGTIWVSYTHNRETIGWVHFNEAWLMQGGDQVNLGSVP